MITLDATRKGENANSYITIEDANDLLAVDYGCEEWSTFEESEKVALLITATEQIDSLRLQAGLNPSSAQQNLKFPLAGFTDKDWQKIKKACSKQAFFIWLSHGTRQEAIIDSIQSLTTEGLTGTSGLTRHVGGYNPFRKISPDVQGLLADWITFAMEIQ